MIKDKLSLIGLNKEGGQYVRSGNSRSGLEAAVAARLF
jgi:hypothetical protein